MSKKTNDSKNRQAPDLKVTQQRSSSRLAAIRINQPDDMISYPSFTGAMISPGVRINNKIDHQPSYVIRRSNSLWKQEKSQSDILVQNK